MRNKLDINLFYFTILYLHGATNKYEENKKKKKENQFLSVNFLVGELSCRWPISVQ